MNIEPSKGKKILGAASLILSLYMAFLIGSFAIDFYLFVFFYFLIFPIFCISFYGILRNVLFKEEYDENLKELVWLGLGMYIPLLINFIYIILKGTEAMIY